MDSGRVHETSWPEEYATGRLPVERRVEFESHLVGCPECLDRVEAAERMRSGIHELERRQPAAAPAPSRRRAGPRWVTRVGWAVAAAAAVAVAFWSGTQRTRSAEQSLASERETLARTQAELGRTREELERARRAPEVAPPRPPLGRVPVLALMTRRGRDVPSVVLPASGPVALWVERELPVRFERYHLRVRSEQGADVFEDDVAPTTREAVLVALDARGLPPGLYTLVLEGEARGGRRIPVAQHPFRTLAGPVR
jgi:hypothetical protein